MSSLRFPPPCWVNTFRQALARRTEGACEAIAAEAETFTLNGENMKGIVYGEDAAGGRAPSAQDLETAHLKVLPKDLSYSGQALETTGRLCLRHPLPAVVFTDVVSGMES